MRFTAHSVDIDSSIVGAITSVSLPTNTETTGDDGGELYNTSRSLVSQFPVFSVTTKSVQAALKKVGLTGLCFSAALSNGPIDIFGKVGADCKNSPASTDNARYRIAAGLIVPTTLTIPRVGDATLTMDIHCLSEGGNAPFAFSYSSITLPSSPTIEKYGMGTSEVHGTTWPEATDFSLNFNNQIIEKLPALAGVWPEVTGVNKSEPVINLSSRDPTILDAAKIPLLGADPVHTDSKFQLVKKKNDGAYESAASTVHMNFTANGLALMDNPFSASGSGEADVTARVECTYDGTNAPIVFAFDQAYDSDLSD